MKLNTTKSSIQKKDRSAELSFETKYLHSLDCRFPPSAYNVRISRQLLLGLTGISISALRLAEKRGALAPARHEFSSDSRRVSYEPKDVEKILDRRNKSFGQSTGNAEVIALWSVSKTCGKAAFVQQLSSLLSLAAPKGVLVIDLDPHALCSSAMNFDPETEYYTFDEFDITSANRRYFQRLQSANDYPDLLAEPSHYLHHLIRRLSPTLSIFENDFSFDELNSSFSEVFFGEKQVDSNEERASMKIRSIKEVIARFKRHFDFIILDCPASLGPLFASALSAADRLMIPVEFDSMAERTIATNAKFLQCLQEFESDFRPKKVHVVLNKIGKLSRATKALYRLEEICERSDELSLSSVLIPRLSLVENGLTLRFPVFLVADKNPELTKRQVSQARIFTNLLWIALHELLDRNQPDMVFN